MPHLSSGRVRIQAGARHKVAAKRSYANYLLPYKAMNWSKSRTALINPSAFPGPPTEARTPVEAESAADVENERSKLVPMYEFRPGWIPPCRQMFYQYCDIQVN
jgi:general transcription factor 3C polypeptide 5 (transcription factor C subunit 1)